MGSEGRTFGPGRCATRVPCCRRCAGLAPSAAERVGTAERKTHETRVSVSIGLDGTGIAKNSTGVPFLNHMLDQISSHGLFDLCVDAEVRVVRGMCVCRVCTLSVGGMLCGERSVWCPRTLSHHAHSPAECVGRYVDR